MRFDKEVEQKDPIGEFIGYTEGNFYLNWGKFKEEQVIKYRLT